VVKGVTNLDRDTAITRFRQAVCRRLEFVPFVHQAQAWAAADGLVLTDTVTTPGHGVEVLLPDETTEWRVTLPRPGGRARVVSDLGSFKIGKSKGAAMWACGFAAVPHRRVKLVGVEYDTCVPEFEYLLEALCSERGMNLPFTSLQNRPRDGRMFLDLANGSRYEARSWERKDGLKGKEDDCYVYCLPLDAPVWMGDYSFRPISTVRVDDEVIGWCRSHPERSRAKNPARYETDRLCRAKVLAVHRTRQALVKVTLASGRTLVCTPDHRWLSASGNNDYVTPQVGRRLCHIIDRPADLDHPQQLQAAWLGGMYDGEGSRTLISQSPSHNPVLYAELQRRMIAIGLQAQTAADGVRWLGGRQAALNVVAWLQSVRYREKYADEALLGGRFREADEIVSIEDVASEAEVACLTTTTGNFVAYGYASHNCEAYQLPGLECYTDFKQNLTRRNGYAYIATTPDRPWVKVFHERGHDDPEFPNWQCVCGVARDINPYTFDAKAKAQDQRLMTREKFAIAYEGKLGEFVGSVYSYQRGQKVFTTKSHPQLWLDPSQPPTPENLAIPASWTVLGGADTGTFTSCTITAFDPGGTAYVLFEAPNYRYVGGRHEWTDLSIPEWAHLVTGVMRRFGVRGLYADKNTQFRREFQHYGLTLFGSDAGIEQRTEISREYFQHDRIVLAPWLQVLPYELEQAEWPEAESLAGKFGRLKKQDHTLDTLEHVLARRPMTRATSGYQPATWLEEYGGRRPGTVNGDPHLGVQ